MVEIRFEWVLQSPCAGSLISGVAILEVVVEVGLNGRKLGDWRVLPSERINVALLEPWLVPTKQVIIKRTSLAPELHLLSVLPSDCFLLAFTL